MHFRDKLTLVVTLVSSKLGTQPENNKKVIMHPLFTHTGVFTYMPDPWSGLAMAVHKLCLIDISLTCV